MAGQLAETTAVPEQRVNSNDLAARVYRDNPTTESAKVLRQSGNLLQV